MERPLIQSQWLHQRRMPIKHVLGRIKWNSFGEDLYRVCGKGVETHMWKLQNVYILRTTRLDWILIEFDQLMSREDIWRWRGCTPVVVPLWQSSWIPALFNEMVRAYISYWKPREPEHVLCSPSLRGKSPSTLNWAESGVWGQGFE